MTIAPTTVRLRDGTAAVLRSPAAADAPTVLACARDLSHDAAECLNGLPDRFDDATVDDEVAVSTGSRPPRGTSCSSGSSASGRSRC